MSDGAIVDGTSAASGDDTLVAWDDGSKLVGGSGDDTLVSGSGDDVLNGGSGTDTAYYDADVHIFVNNDGVLTLYDEKGNTITFDAGEFGGTDTLKSIEVIEFNNYTYYLDGRNNAVKAFADAEETDEDTAINNFNVLENDIDLDGDELTVTGLDTTGSTGSFTLNIDGTISYDPNGGFEYLASGETTTDSVSYTVTDGKGSIATGIFTVTITGANDAPIVSSPVTGGSTEDDAIFSVALLDGASDVDTSDTLAVANLILTNGDDSGVTLNGTSLDVNPDAYDYLNDGEVAVIEYSYDVIDGKGGSTPQTATITITGVSDNAGVSGVTVDGYFQGATVFVDENNNQVLDAGEESTLTDGMGAFVLATSGPLVMTGGVDVATGLSFEGALRAPDGSTSITALSTIVSELMDLGLTKVNAESLLIDSLVNIDPSIDILNLDPITASLAGTTGGQEVMATASQVLNTVIQVASLLQGAGSTNMADNIAEVFKQIAIDLNGLSAGETYDLTLPVTIESLITDASAALALTGATIDASSVTATLSGAAVVISGANQATQDVLDSATTGGDFLTDITQIGIVTQGEISQSLTDATAATDSATAIATVEVDYTLSNLTTAIEAAASSVGDIDGITSFTYTPTSGDAQVYNIGFAGGLTLFDGTSFFDPRTDTGPIDQLIIDNSLSTEASNSIDFRSNMASANLTDYGIVYYGGSGMDITTAYTALGTQIEVHGGDGVDLLSGGDGNDLLYGDGGRDHLFGGSGDDILVGGEDLDTLYGHGGADRFVWLQGDANGTFDIAQDRDAIADFEVGIGGDTIDLTDLLSNVTAGLDETGSALDPFLDFSVFGSGSLIDIDIDGNGSVDHQIILSDTDVTNAGTKSDVQIIDSLLKNNNLDVIDGDIAVISQTFTPSLGSVWVYDDPSVINGMIFSEFSGPEIPGESPSPTFDVPFGPVDQLTIDNSSSTTDNDIEVNFGVVISDHYLVDYELTYLGGSGKDDFTVRTDITAQMKVHLGDGNDKITAGDGNDLLFGDGGNDALNGNGGDDSLFGGDGDDVLDGGHGNNILRGEAGHDIFLANAGNNVIVGGLGSDTALGGGGAVNRFVFEQGDTADAGVERDYIYDFKIDAQTGAPGDTLDLRGLLSAVTTGLTENGASLDHLLDFNTTAQGLEISVDVDGNGMDVTSSTSLDQVIVLAGFFDAAGAPDTFLIDAMLNAGYLDVI